MSDRKADILLEVECDSIEEFQKKVSEKRTSFKEKQKKGAGEKLLAKLEESLKKHEGMLKELEDICKTENLNPEVRKEEILLKVECETLEEFQGELSKKQARLQEKKRTGADERTLRGLQKGLDEAESLMKEYLSLESSEDSSSTDVAAKELESSGPSSSHPSSSHEGSDHVSDHCDETVPVPQTTDVVCDIGTVLPEISEALAASEVSEASRDDVTTPSVNVESPAVRFPEDRSTTLNVDEPQSEDHSTVYDKMEASRPASIILDLHKVVAGIRNHQHHSAMCRNKNAAFVLGTTGAGKSTTLCWLLGKPPVWEKREETVKDRVRYKDYMVVKDPPEGLDVGHNDFKSQTRYLRSYPDPELDLVWVDTPGWGDTEGSEVDIANAVGIAYTIHSCKSVLPILLISGKALPNERGRYLRSLVHLVTRFITADFQENIKALKVFFTHVAAGQTSEDLWFLFGNFQEEQKSDPEVSLFLEHVMHLLHEDIDQNTLLLNPVDENPHAVKNIVQKACPIVNVKEAFGSPLSDSDRSKLRVACDKLVQEVKDSLRDLDFPHLQKVLDTLLKLNKTSQLAIVKSAYTDAGRSVLDSFHGKLTAASRSFDEFSFESTRQQLQNINDRLLIHTSALEEEEEKCNPGFQSIKRRRDDLVFRINAKIKYFKDFVVSSLQEYGSEDFPQVKWTLDIMEDLSKTLEAQLLDENKNAYQESVQVLSDSIGEYNKKVQDIVDRKHWGFDLGLVTHHVRPSQNSAISPLTDLALTLRGLGAAISAGQGHVQANLLTLYRAQVEGLQDRAECCKAAFAEKLQLIFGSHQVNVEPCVEDLVMTLLVPWAIHDSLSDHVTKEVADTYTQCLRMLEDREVLLSGALDDSFKLHRFELVAKQLCEMDVLRQVCQNSTMGLRFKDSCKRLTGVVENLASEIQQWLPKAGIQAPSDVFARVSRDLDLLQCACSYLSKYFEDGRTARSFIEQEIETCATSSETDPNVNFVAQAGLSELCTHFTGKLKSLVTESLESASNCLDIKDFKSLDKHMSQLDDMWPIREHVEGMEDKYKRFAAIVKSHAYDLSRNAEESSNPTAAQFDPSCIKEHIELIDGFLPLLQAHEKGRLYQLVIAVSTSAEELDPISRLVKVRQITLDNIETKISTLQEIVASKISQQEFEAPGKEMTLLKLMANSLHNLVGERASDVLQSSISVADKKLVDCEQKVRGALGDENLQVAEQINAGTVQKMLLLQEFIPRIQSVASNMQHEIAARKDAFVQKVCDLLQNGLYDDLDKIMHGAKEQLQAGVPEDNKRWLEAQRLLIDHFRMQHEGAQAVLQGARMSLPVNLSLVNFTLVIEATMKFHSIEGKSLSGFLPDYGTWCTTLIQAIKELLQLVEDGGRRGLSKWKFAETQRVRDDMNILASVKFVEIGKLCFEALRGFDQGIADKVDNLPSDLNAMINYGYNHREAMPADRSVQPEEEADLTDSRCKRCTEDNLKCTCGKCEFRSNVSPSRIDNLFNGLRRASESSLPHDFDELYEQMILALENNLQNLYNAIKLVLKHGNVEAAEKMIHLACRLRNSTTVSTQTVFTVEKHNKTMWELNSMKEEFMTKSRARQDPVGFKRQLDELKDSDYTVYLKMVKPFKEEIFAERACLKKDISNLTNLDDDHLEAIIKNLWNQHSYNLAIEGHGDADQPELCITELLGQLKKMLQKIIATAKQVQASGQVQQMESHSNFISSAISHLKATKVDAFIGLAKFIESEHDDLVKSMHAGLEEMRAGWNNSVVGLDVCISNPPISRLVDYMKRLQTSNTHIHEQDGSEISFKAAVAHVQKVLVNLNIQSLWTECLEPLPTGQDSRLAIAMSNLQHLTREFPSCVMGDMFQNLVNDVARHKESLQDETMKKFQHVQECPMTDAEQNSAYKQINKLMEKSDRAKRSLQRITAIFPSQEEDKVVESMKKVVTDLHKAFVDNPQKDIGNVKRYLISAFKVKSSVSNPIVGQHVSSVVESVLTTLRREKLIEFGSLASALCGDALGGQIVEEFDQFRQFKLDLFKNKTANMDWTHALDDLVKLNKFDTNQKDMLRQSWNAYERSYYNFLDRHLFHGLEALCQEVVAFMRSDTNGKALQVPQVLGGIGAAVAMHMSDLSAGADASGVSQESKMAHPHPVQILSLLRLLRADQPPATFWSRVYKVACNAFGYQLNSKSHLIQIGTGEGKSIVLAMLSIFLALCGYTIDCVCYSKYLSDRDRAAFKGLFVAFGIQDQVQYGTFSALARQQVNEAGDVRMGTKALIEDTLVEGTIKPNGAREKILLIDEVDVFFSEDFYGKLYRPSVLIQAPEITELLSFIWQNRGPGLTLESVRSSPAYSQIAATYLPRLQRLIDSHISAMIHATTTYDKPENAYEVEDGRIGYVEHGTVNTTFRRGYNTTFCYFQELERGSISKSVFDEFMGLDIRCGSFSYAEIPHNYKRILGVTGTLESLGEFERNTIKDIYNISDQTITPSIYGIRDTNFDKGVHIESGKSNYHRKILDEINEVVSVDRAALVFFESEQTLQEFQNSEYGSRLSDASAVTSGNVEHIHHYVKQSTRSKEVTLFPRVFGRGLDFVCYDKVVAEHGGVAVIQTFLSEDVAEEIQIKGRTCRQGEKGTYKMILLEEDLTGWHMAKTRSSKKSSSTPIFTKEELDKNKGPDLYAWLHPLRTNWFTEQSQTRQRVVNAALEQHTTSSRFQQMLCKPTAAVQKDLVAILSDMNQGLTPCNKYHIVLCLDESGSMKGRPWGQLTTAFEQFISVCNDHSDGGDLISIVQFSHIARTTLRKKTLQQASTHKLVMEIGGTAFRPALERAQSLFQETHGLVPMLVFMSDGENTHEEGDPDVSKDVRHMTSLLPDLQCHTVFFGRSQGSELLEKMARAVGGKFHLSADGVQLTRTFSSIAADVTAL